jgi:hypothetical protein
VRHLRDGVIDNNRSKARLIEAVHQLTQGSNDLFYFPAYELVIDVLRDYRFYDIDLAHPNYMATSYVLERFAQTCFENETRAVMEDVKKIMIAKKHKAFQPSTKAHKDFLKTYAARTGEMLRDYPFLDLADELAYFNAGI